MESLKEGISIHCTAAQKTLKSLLHCNAVKCPKALQHYQFLVAETLRCSVAAVSTSTTYM